MLAILMPTLMGIVGLVIDGGLMMGECRQLQHATDAAATAAATDLRLGKSDSLATATATDFVHNANELSDASVTVNIPLVSGKYAGQPLHVEAVAERDYQSRFMRILDGVVDRTIHTRSVAGVENATAGAAIIVLDPDPADLTAPGTDEMVAAVDEDGLASDAIAQLDVGGLLSSVPAVGPAATSLVNNALDSLVPDLVSNLLGDAQAGAAIYPLPTLTAGLEIEGIGRLDVDGAVLVNTEWGGQDENGEPAGAAPGPPYAVACMPVLATSSLRARDLRVVGGVDNPDFYQPFVAGDSNPLQANRLPVPDPFESLPVPSAASDAANVSTAVQTPSHRVVIAVPQADVEQLTATVSNQLPALLKPLFQPLIAPLTQSLTQPTLQPGVYDSITVLAPMGGVHFDPGVYIIRNNNPISQLSLCILGPVDAAGVLFYITDSAGYSGSTGLPDGSEDASTAPANPITSLLPSTLIAPLLSGGHISGLNDPSSPFDGMLIYQRRLDRRPILLEAQQIIGSGDISGTIYSKWGHVAFVGALGTYDLRFVTGTMRVLTVGTSTLDPTDPLPPASDVFLLE